MIETDRQTDREEGERVSVCVRTSVRVRVRVWASALEGVCFDCVLVFCFVMGL